MPKVDAERAEVRASLAAKAEALASEVEAAVDRFATHDWLQSESYNRAATTWPTEILDLERYGLANHNTTPIPWIRAALVRCVTACPRNPRQVKDSS